MHRLGFILILIVAVALSTAGRAVQRDQDEPIRLRSNLVPVIVAVADAKGRPIKNLTADDFTVYEDGARQKIAHFARTDEAFAVMLLLDISGSTLNDIDLIKRAAKNFIKHLGPTDRAGAIVFSREVELIADFEDPPERLVSEMDRISTAPGSNSSRFTSNTGTSFYDALFLAVEESPLKKVEGRKAIVCVSDGVDSTSKTGYGEVARLIEQSGASVYFLALNTEAATLEGLLRPFGDVGYIGFSESQINRYYDRFDPDSPDRFRPRNTIPALARREINAGLYDIAEGEQAELAKRAGGRVYPVSALTDLEAVLKQVAGDLRSQYSIGYYPTNEARDGGWRSIRVEVRQKDATVRARSGYWAPAR